MLFSIKYIGIRILDIKKIIIDYISNIVKKR